MYTINREGIKSYTHVRIEFFRTITLLPIGYSVILVLLYYSIGSKFIFLFYILLLINIIYYCIFSIYAIIKLINRQHKTITEILFSDNEITIKTKRILWLRPLNIHLHKSKISFSERKFKWYGVKEKEGMSIHINNLDLFLVKEFFDDYTEIEQLIVLAP